MVLVNLDEEEVRGFLVYDELKYELEDDPVYDGEPPYDPVYDGEPPYDPVYV